jgi:hypothetical protein
MRFTCKNVFDYLTNEKYLYIYTYVYNSIKYVERAVTNEQSLHTRYALVIIFDFPSAAKGSVMIYPA